ncbi:MAG: HlyC/CorC family transporter [Hyphomicrobiales bacterium]|nr:HlyC/CorC family transporter [Hyphomicrobiales bacterium]
MAEQGARVAGASRNLPVPVAAQVPAPPASESWFVRAIRALFGWRPESFRSDLRSVLEGRAFDTRLSQRETVMLRNILGLRERRAVDVMVPRADIVAVQKEIALGDLMKVFESAAHSRLVVYDETLDDAVGMVHIRDLIAYMTARAAVAAQANSKRKKPFPAGLDLKAIDLSVSLDAAGIVREMLFVPPSMPVMDLLARMQTSRTHLALVVDEYGGADGVVSIEDIVEQIVGEIADEHDEDAAVQVVAQPDGSFLADARAHLEDVTAIVGPEFDVGDVAKEVDTLAGYIAARIGRVPVRGELVPGPGRYEIEVLDADPRRVKRLKIFVSQDLVSQDRGGHRGRDAHERVVPAARPSAGVPRADLPLAREASVKLSPDDPAAKASREP